MVVSYQSPDKVIHIITVHVFVMFEFIIFDLISFHPKSPLKCDLQLLPEESTDSLLSPASIERGTIVVISYEFCY